MIRRAEDILKSTGVVYARDVDLASYSTFGISAIAALLAAPTGIDELVELLSQLERAGLPYRVIGGMSNTMPSALRYNGVAINLRKINRKYVAENTVTAECGATLASIVRELSRYDLGGLEQLFHIPGTLGGAVYGNAGAHGLEIADVLVGAELYDPERGERLVMTRDGLGFSYRDSRLKDERLILLSATLVATPKPVRDIDADIERYRDLRRNQPRGVKTLGSTFKRVNGVSAGYYIDRAGLKGLSVGDAVVSEVHAGFIVNCGGATPRDVLCLIERIKSRVHSEFGITLEEEICLL